jgi:hypothetical protein
MDRKEIKEIRETLNLNREEFANVLGSHSASVHRWETNASSSPDKSILGYLLVMQKMIKQGRANKLSDNLRNALVMGGHLLALYTLLKMFFEEK